MPTEGALRFAILIPRFFLAAIFLIAVYPKLTAPHGFAPLLVGFLSAVAPKSAAPWYLGFLQTVVIPNASIFAPLIVAGELFVGLGLLTGTLTRLAGIVALLLNANYMLAKGATLWTPSSNDAADIMLALIVILTRPGRYYGVDAVLKRRKRY